MVCTLCELTVQEKVLCCVLFLVYCMQVKYKRTALLQSPVVEEMMTWKWRTFGLPVFIFSFLLYSLFLFLLTAVILVGPFPQGEMCSGNELYAVCMGIDFVGFKFSQISQIFLSTKTLHFISILLKYVFRLCH